MISMTVMTGTGMRWCRMRVDDYWWQSDASSEFRSWLFIQFLQYSCSSESDLVALALVVSSSNQWSNAPLSSLVSTLYPNRIFRLSQHSHVSEPVTCGQLHWKFLCTVPLYIYHNWRTCAPCWSLYTPWCDGRISWCLPVDVEVVVVPSMSATFPSD